MKSSAIRSSSGLLMAASLAGPADLAQADIAFKFVSAGDARKMVAGPKAPDSLADDGGFSMALRQREASSHVEKHMGWNEELVIQEGDVLLNYGGARPMSGRPAPVNSMVTLLAAAGACDACRRHSDNTGWNVARRSPSVAGHALYPLQDEQQLFWRQIVTSRSCMNSFEMFLLERTVGPGTATF